MSFLTLRFDALEFVRLVVEPGVPNMSNSRIKLLGVLSLEHNHAVVHVNNMSTEINKPIQ